MHIMHHCGEVSVQCLQCCRRKPARAQIAERAANQIFDGGSILSRQPEFLAIPEDEKEDHLDSQRNESADQVASNLLGDMLTDDHLAEIMGKDRLRDDKSDNLLGGNLLGDDDAMFSDNKSAQLGTHFLEAQSQSDDQGGNLLKDEVIFDPQVLDELRSERSGGSKRRPMGNQMLSTGFLELEKRYQELEGKYKDQQNINSELADKIQQLEFDKDMMFKENENLKKRAYDFQGLLEQSEVQAQIEFKEQEISEYKQKLEEERNHN